MLPNRYGYAASLSGSTFGRRFFEARQIAGNTFQALKEGTIRAEVRHRYPLAAAADAHRDLEARRTIGSLVLIP